ncbi:hypothetical protein WJX72_005918 [[Myrmecia] bisecta]|uniref:Uncharacterized protein n=1 Tax=[Myrmecia] bisecta TaxID=41462 RepID=A0AAW1Q6T6_9CHLO
MGKRDPRSRRGKVFRGTSGKARPWRPRPAWRQMQPADQDAPIPIPFPPPSRQLYPPLGAGIDGIAGCAALT